MIFLGGQWGISADVYRPFEDLVNEQHINYLAFRTRSCRCRKSKKLTFKLQDAYIRNRWSTRESTESLKRALFGLYVFEKARDKMRFLDLSESDFLEMIDIYQYAIKMFILKISCSQSEKRKTGQGWFYVIRFIHLLYVDGNEEWLPHDYCSQNRSFLNMMRNSNILVDHSARSIASHRPKPKKGGHVRGRVETYDFSLCQVNFELKEWMRLECR